jgi:hypothetical protein
MAEQNKNLTTLDFETIKDNLKTYLKNQDIFKDYDFDGSNLNVLLDVLSYNTQLNAFYLNMIGAEMFLDSAILRDSVVSHAKELNYLPRSYRSAYANVSISATVSTGTGKESTFALPKGSSFTSRVGSRNFTFVTSENNTLQGSLQENNRITYSISDLLIYEGDYITETYFVDEQNPNRYIISNPSVDTTSITVDVIEDEESTTIPYTVATSLFGLNEESKIFFVQGAENETYEVLFGDGVIGRKPKNGSRIEITYRRTNGSIVDGLKNFIADFTIHGQQPTIVINAPARYGSDAEDLNSIKYNAPRAFSTQERAVTTDDYENLLRSNFADINTVAAFGGEQLSPPRYGKVYISVDLNTSDSLPPSRREVFRRFLLDRTPLSIDPIFVEPTYTYVEVDTTVKYDIRLTTLGDFDIKDLVTSAILAYNNSNIDGFKKTLRYSRLVTAIDAADDSIISNETNLRIVKNVNPVIGVPTDYQIDFGIPLKNDLYLLGIEHESEDTNIIISSQFLYGSRPCFLEDNGDGIIRIMTKEFGRHTLVKNQIGTIDYDTGYMELNQFAPALLTGNPIIKIYAKTRIKDITSSRNVILSIPEENIKIKVERITA